MIEFRDDHWDATGGEPADRLLARVAAFVPGWDPGGRGPGRALLEVAGRFVGLIEDRLSRAPDKGKLALLDALGVAPIPPYPARCPVVFDLAPGADHGRADAHTRLGAQVDGGATVDFETDTRIGLAATRLAEVKASLPGDRYTDHTADALGGRSFTLFDGPRPVPRELYLGHDRLFALTPGAVVELQIDLAPDSGELPPGSEVLWDYWDGLAWVGFVPFARPGSGSTDGTRNLSRSGAVRLVAGERAADRGDVRGVNTYWVRARLRRPSGDEADTRSAGTVVPAPPRIDRIRARLLQSVGGFRVFARTERPVDPVKGRLLRVRLVDDSGSPLTVTFRDAERYAVTDRLSGTGFKYDQPSGYFRPTLPAFEHSAVSLDLRVGAVPGTPARPPWDLPRVTGLLPDRSDDLDLARAGLLPEVAFGNGISVDPSATFLPFGPQPPAGAAFHFACPEVTNKPGARVTAFVEVTPLPGDVSTQAAMTARIAVGGGPATAAPSPTLAAEPIVRWEYWNGLVWAPLPELEAVTDPTKSDTDRAAQASRILSFRESGEVRFAVAANISPKSEFGQQKPWLRARLVSGGYLVLNGGSTTVQQSNPTPVYFDKVFPPEVQRLRIGYEYTSPPEPPRACLSYDEFRWVDATARVTAGGDPFVPFGTATDARPTLYLGFSRPLPTDLVSLFFDVESTRPEPELTWEYADGTDWRPLLLDADETNALSRPGIARFVWPGIARTDPEPTASAADRTVTFPDPKGAARYQPGDDVAVYQDDDGEVARVKEVRGPRLVLEAPLSRAYPNPRVGFAPPARFGAPRFWVRVVWPRAEYPGPEGPDRVRVSGVYLNAVWAEQVRTQEDEVLGGSTGVGGETFDFARPSVLAGEAVYVRELDGARADAEHPALREELLAAGKKESDLRLDRDPKTGKVTAAWVRWDGRPNFTGSGPEDRHYTVERVRGRVQFGDGTAGMVPPPGPGNIRATYRAGGGRAGNVPGGAVKVLLGSVPGVQRVFNPLAAGGGADGELAAASPAPGRPGRRPDPARAILARGPQLVRHRYRAVTAADYEQLALTASPGVAAARAVTPAETRGAVPAGTVRVVVVPAGAPADSRLTPGPDLREQVRAYLQARAPGGTRVEVAAPDYFPVGVEAVLVPKDPAQAGQLTRAARAVIAAFLHPVTGGPDGTGWGTSRAIRRSALVARLHRDLPDLLNFAEDVRFLVDGVPVAEQVDVPPGRFPSAGSIRVSPGAAGEVCR